MSDHGYCTYFVAAIFQFRSLTVVSSAIPDTVTPFMYQTAFRPFAPVLQRISGLPSPSKSVAPTMFQLRSVVVGSSATPVNVTRSCTRPQPGRSRCFSRGHRACRQR